MTLLQRLTRLLKADLHGILDGLEDAEEVVKQTIRDMEEALTAKEQTLAALHISLQHLTTEAQDTARTAEEIEQRLDLCFQEGNETLARAYIRKRLETAAQGKRVARALEDTQARRVALEHRITEQRVQLAAVLQQLHSFAEARQRQTGTATPFMPGAPEGSINEDDIEVAFLQEKRRRATPAQAH